MLMAISIWGIWWNTFKRIFVRFQRLIGNQCHYMCADDAHGTAIMLSAEKEGIKQITLTECVINI